MWPARSLRSRTHGLRTAARLRQRDRRLSFHGLENRLMLSAGDIEWLNQFGSTDPAFQTDVAQAADADGNVYVGGRTAGALPGQTSAGSADGFVRMYDADGTELWTRQFGTGATEHVSGVSADASGVYVVGRTDGSLPGQSAAGGSDAFIRKYDTSGSELWTRQFGTASNDEAFSVSVDASGVYVAGETRGSLPGQSQAGGADAFIRKYDADGTELWTHQFGSSFNDQVSAVSAADSGIFVAGRTRGALPGQVHAGDQDAFVRRYDADGGVVWTRQFGTVGGDEAEGISVDSSGVYVAGFAAAPLPGQSSAGNVDAFVRKYDVDGGEVWTRQFGSSAFDRAVGVSADASGVYLAGVTVGDLPGQTSAGGFDAFVRKYDATGGEQWTRQFGTSNLDEGLGISANDSGVFVVGRTGDSLPGQTSSGLDDAFVRRYDFDGGDVWTRQFGSVLPAFENEIARAVDVDGNVYVAGGVAGTFAGQTSAGNYDVFVRKYDSAGNEIWTRQFGSSGFDYGLGLSVDATGVYVAGRAAGAIPGQSSSGVTDAFVRKYDFDGTEVWTRQFGTSGFEEVLGVSATASGVYLAGRIRGAFPGQTDAGGDDIFVRKYAADGTELWTRQFGTSGFDTAEAITADASGVYVTGFVGDALPGQVHTGGDDVFVRKYDSDGNELWTSQFGSASFDRAGGIATGPSGVYVVGMTVGVLPGATSVGGYDAFLRRYDPSGGVQWTRQLGTTDYDQAFGVSVDESGVYVAGMTLGSLPGQTQAGGGDAFVSKYDIAGTELWSRQFGTPEFDQARGISVNSSAIYVAGETNGTFAGQTSSGERDAFVARLSQNQPPVINDQSFTLDENSSNLTVVGTAVATDPDLPGDTLTWSITAGNTGGAFAINPSDGQITVANKSALDFETTPVFALTVEVQDESDETDDATITINLNDLEATLSIT